MFKNARKAKKAVAFKLCVYDGMHFGMISMTHQCRLRNGRMICIRHDAKQKRLIYVLKKEVCSFIHEKSRIMLNKIGNMWKNERFMLFL